MKAHMNIHRKSDYSHLPEYDNLSNFIIVLKNSEVEAFTPFLSTAEYIGPQRYFRLIASLPVTVIDLTPPACWAGTDQVHRA